MKIEEIKKVTDQQIKRLMEALKDGKSDGVKELLSAMAKFAGYSFRNTLLIISQRPDATNVAGFGTWRSKGRFVKKGEKGIVIFAPHIGSSGDEAALKGEESKIRGFRAKYLFDVAQTDGEPLPEVAKSEGNPGENLEALKAYIKTLSIELTYSTTLESALGVSKGGSIVIREGLTPSEEFSTLVHELAHELLHQGVNRSTKSKEVKETEAEAVATVVGESLGLNSLNAARDYIHLSDGDFETLQNSLNAIQATATQILNALLPGE